jgi:hypothetical protein
MFLVLISVRGWDLSFYNAPRTEMTALDIVMINERGAVDGAIIGRGN